MEGGEYVPRPPLFQRAAFLLVNRAVDEILGQQSELIALG